MIIENKNLYLYILFYFHGDWGLGIGDWGLGIGPNPQSPFNFEIFNYIVYNIIITQ